MLIDDCTVEFCFTESSNKAALKSVRQILLQSYSGKKVVDFGKPVWDNAVANKAAVICADLDELERTGVL